MKTSSPTRGELLQLAERARAYKERARSEILRRRAARMLRAA